MRIILFALTVLWVTIKRIVRNWRLTLALTAGLVLATGIMAAVPIYSSASLQKSFLRGWVEVDAFRPPFAVITAHGNDRRRYDISPERLDRLSTLVGDELPQAVRQEATTFASYGRIGPDPILRESDGAPNLLSPAADLCFLSNLASIGEIVDGRWYRKRTDGVVEVVVDQSTLERLELVVGGRYVFYYASYDSEPANQGERYVPVEIEVVGLFRAAPGTTTEQWIYPPPFSRRIFAEPTVFRTYLQGHRQLRVDDYHYLSVFDFQQVRVDRANALGTSLREFEQDATRVAPETVLWRSPVEFFDEFSLRNRSVSHFILAIALPALGMILYYVVLMASVSVDNRRSEITVLQSRGAGRFQIMLSFVIEWALLGLVALLAGPYLGLAITRIMGSSSEFLGFVNRTALPAVVNRGAFLYALIANTAAVGAATAPVFSTFRHSIVTLRTQQARELRPSALHRYFLDVIFLALAVFGHRALSWEQVALSPNATIDADPFLFVVPVVGVLGCGLLFLRLYPLIMAGLARATSGLRGVVWQLVFRQLGRNAGRKIPVLLLLIITVSLGLYTASSARTLAVNSEDQIHYRVGADLVIGESWEDADTDPFDAGSTPPPPPSGEVAAEPPLLMREEMDGVEAVARVLRGSSFLGAGGRTIGRAHLMAIAPWEFARVAWHRDDLFEAPFMEYLHMLNRHRGGIIVSRSLFNRMDVDLGTLVTVDYDGELFDTYVVAVVDYWPGIDPSERNNRFFVIANLTYVQDQTRLRPYDGWYRTTDNLDLQALVDELARRGIYAREVTDARTEITTLRREPYRMGFYGILSMGFLVAAAVTALGFLVITFYSVRSRVIQFGALRANGLSSWQLVAIVGLEQLVSLSLGLGAGYGLGRAAVSIFLPFLRDRAGDIQRVPPFIIITELSDINVLFAAIVGVFVVAVIGLSLFLLRKRVFRLLKLGEEA